MIIDIIKPLIFRAGSRFGFLTDANTVESDKPLAMGTNKITSSYVPSADVDVVNKLYADTKVAKAGGTATGTIINTSSGEDQTLINGFKTTGSGTGDNASGFLSTNAGLSYNGIRMRQKKAQDVATAANTNYEPHAGGVRQTNLVVPTLAAVLKLENAATTGGTTAGVGIDDASWSVFTSIKIGDFANQYIHPIAWSHSGSADEKQGFWFSTSGGTMGAYSYDDATQKRVITKTEALFGQGSFNKRRFDMTQWTAIGAAYNAVANTFTMWFIDDEGNAREIPDAGFEADAGVGDTAVPTLAINTLSLFPYVSAAHNGIWASNFAYYSSVKTLADFRAYWNGGSGLDVSATATSNWKFNDGVTGTAVDGPGANDITIDATKITQNVALTTAANPITTNALSIEDSPTAGVKAVQKIGAEGVRTEALGGFKLPLMSSAVAVAGLTFWDDATHTLYIYDDTANQWRSLLAT